MLTLGRRIPLRDEAFGHVGQSGRFGRACPRLPGKGDLSSKEKRPFPGGSNLLLALYGLLYISLRASF